MKNRIGQAGWIGWIVAAGGLGAMFLIAIVGITVSASTSLNTGCQVNASSGWLTVGATLDPSYAPNQAYPQWYNQGFSYAELGAAPDFPNYVGGLIAKALGIPSSSTGLPPGYPLLIRAVGSSGSGTEIYKSDIGSGQAGDLHYVIDLHPAIAQQIGFDGKEDVEIAPVGTVPSGTAACTPDPGGYVNPFANTTDLSPERIDMGVDFNGSGPIDALGEGTVVAEAAGGTGWDSPEDTQACVVYRLTDGAYAGKDVYVCEDIVPTVTVGETVQAGQEIATFKVSSTGLETGWAVDNTWTALAVSLNEECPGGQDPGCWSSGAGNSFNRLLLSVGAKGGVEEQPAPNQSVPAGYP